MVLHNRYRCDRGKTRATELTKLDDDLVVVSTRGTDEVLQYLEWPAVDEGERVCTSDALPACPRSSRRPSACARRWSARYWFVCGVHHGLRSLGSGPLVKRDPEQMLDE
jgi:hypothetical protein